MTTHARTLSRRTFTAAAGGFAAGIFATRFSAVAAQDASPVPGATPVPVSGLGHVLLQTYYLADAALRPGLDQVMVDQLAPAAAGFDGYAGFLIGNTTPEPDGVLALAMFDDAARAGAFNQLVQGQVAGLGDMLLADRGHQLEGDLMIASGKTASDASPTPIEPLREGYVAVRVHTGLGDADPREFASYVESSFLPLINGIDGFLGYLWFPIEGGFVAISLFDSSTSAVASNLVAVEWGDEIPAEYSAFTETDMEIVNAEVVYVDLPMLGM
jgi:hypothetical protein